MDNCQFANGNLVKKGKVIRVIRKESCQKEKLLKNKTANFN